MRPYSYLKRVSLARHNMADSYWAPTRAARARRHADGKDYCLDPHTVETSDDFIVHYEKLLPARNATHPDGIEYPWMRVPIYTQTDGAPIDPVTFTTEPVMMGFLRNRRAPLLTLETFNNILRRRGRRARHPATRQLLSRLMPCRVRVGAGEEGLERLLTPTTIEDRREAWRLLDRGAPSALADAVRRDLTSKRSYREAEKYEEDDDPLALGLSSSSSSSSSISDGSQASSLSSVYEKSEAEENGSESDHESWLHSSSSSDEGDPKTLRVRHYQELRRRPRYVSMHWSDIAHNENLMFVAPAPPPLSPIPTMDASRSYFLSEKRQNRSNKRTAVLPEEDDAGEYVVDPHEANEKRRLARKAHKTAQRFIMLQRSPPVYFDATCL